MVEKAMMSQCTVKEHAAQPALCVHTRISVQQMSQALGQAYGEIERYLGELGQNPVGPPFVSYYNIDMNDLEIDIGFPVAGKIPDRGEIQSRELPAGPFATYLYKGPYEGIGDGYETLTHWMEEEGYEATGVSYEYYLNDPETTPPQELLTEIRFPLKQA